MHTHATLHQPRRLVGRSDVSLAAAKKSRRKESAGTVGILDAQTHVHIQIHDLRQSRFWKSGIASVAN